LIQDIESKKLLANSKFIDVRPKSQFDVANLKQFTNIPYEELKAMDDEKLQEALGPKEQPSITNKINNFFEICNNNNNKNSIVIFNNLLL